MSSGLYLNLDMDKPEFFSLLMFCLSDAQFLKGLNVSREMWIEKTTFSQWPVKLQFCALNFCLFSNMHLTAFQLQGADLICEAQASWRLPVIAQSEQIMTNISL